MISGHQGVIGMCKYQSFRGYKDISIIIIFNHFSDFKSIEEFWIIGFQNVLNNNVVFTLFAFQINANQLTREPLGAQFNILLLTIRI